MQAERYRCRAPDVIHETFDDEVVIVNLGSGTYYSTDRIAADIWALLLDQARVSDIVLTLQARYSGEPAVIERGVLAFLDKLRTAELIEPSTEPPPNRPEPRTLVATDQPALHAFAEPKLEPYTDMQDLLLLDPIHEVDETGWPKARGNGEPSQVPDGG